MAKLNVPSATQYKSTLKTFEGAPAKKINNEQLLRRSVLSCLLWEDSFYEDGQSIADRILNTAGVLPGEIVSRIAKEARSQYKLRHVPMLLVKALAGGNAGQKAVVAETLENVIQRPDELKEMLAIYWNGGKKPLSAQLKKGLARAFTKFNAYSLAKYNSADSPIKLRDVMFLTHPKPKNDEQAEVWRKLVDGTLESPDTWEVALSAGADKKETFERLIKEGKLGALALLRNLRNMEQAGVDSELIKNAILNMDTERILPFRFISAAKYAPKYEPYLEQAMFKCLEGVEKLPGKTVLLVDNSDSMYYDKVSSKSELLRVDAAGALAILAREICEDVEVIAFSGQPTVVPARRGFALAEAIKKTEHSGTYTERAKQFADKEGYDRIIIITDEQSHQTLSNPNGKGYVINVASYQNGIGYNKWTHMDGWSESVLTFISEYEKEEFGGLV